MSQRLQVVALEPNAEDACRLKLCLQTLDQYTVGFDRLANPAAVLDRFGIIDADVLFIDYDLPTVTGLEVIDAVRAAGEHRPIIATAAEDCGYLAADLIRAGADGYLAKRDCNPGFLGPLLERSFQRAAQRTTQVRLRREAVRELLRSRGRGLALV